VTASVRLSVPTADGMRRLGERLAGLLRAGDLVLLTGDLGAGKTTLAQGLGAGLGVRGDVTSPTFVIAREHRSARGGPDLVHVDAYRLGSLAEVDDLDLDAAVEESVTVVEWGSGLVEDLAASRLEVRLVRLRGGAGDAEGGAAGGDGVVDETRTVEVAGHGPRWAGVTLDALAAGVG
jgi:tRNA threonylcarbamoyladenosine biosynthesis protein TsaE